MGMKLVKLATVLFTLFAALLAHGSACDSTACTENYILQSVVVVDGDNQPVAEATVTATNLDTGKALESKSGVDGKASVGEAIGSGHVRLIARVDADRSAPVDVMWKCDHCHCMPSLDEVTLRVIRGQP